MNHITNNGHHIRIISVEHHSSDTLFSNMRGVTMLENETAYPYLTSRLSLSVLNTNDIAPAQTYVFHPEILKVTALRESLLVYDDTDILKLNGYITITIDGCNHPIDVLPPVVELSEEPDGRVVKILNDGMHRVYLARSLNLPVQVVYAEGIPEQWPYYAYALDRGWDDVEYIYDLPKGFVKKYYRVPEEQKRTLYRNFSSGEFQNVGCPRGNMGG